MRVKTLFLRSTSTALFALCASPALAQDEPAPDPDVQAQTLPNDPAAGDLTAEEGDIVVTGLRRSLETSQNIKRNSDQIVDVVVAEDIARSRSAAGPFETLAASDAPDGVILEQQGIWVAPGHNSLVRDGRGDDWILYHAVDARRPRSKPADEVNTRRVMLLDRIVWRGGWPRVGQDGPSTGPRPRPAFRR